MGDLSPPATSAAGQASSSSQQPSQHSGQPPPDANPQASSFEGAKVPHQHHAVPHQQAFSAQLDMAASSSPGRQGAYNMAPMANTLPQVPYRPGQFAQGQQRYPHPSSPSMMPQMHQMSSYGAPPSMPMQNQGYYVQQQPTMAQYYGATQLSPTQSQANMQSRQNLQYYPNHMMATQPQAAYYYPQTNQYSTHSQGLPGSPIPGQYVMGSPTAAEPLVSGRPPKTFSTQRNSPRDVDNRQNTVRGPPRKPKQSGHAIWVGNLPPQTDLMSLVHHVCREAPGLESLFLISKSNCAFANFKDEQMCVAAQQKLHDSKFQSVRLVSRLRKSTVEGFAGTTAPTGPSANSGNVTTQSDESQGKPSSDGDTENQASAQVQSPRLAPEEDGAPRQDRFFILKSLTLEDLELSVRTGVWATQAHNEEALSNAFKNAENVYLIFSANKSGEYFGYARMLSEINADPAAAIEFAPKVQATSDVDLPKAIPTEATEFAPKGRIIDDSTRGTIFWEADRDDEDSTSEAESEATSNKSAVAEEEGKTCGKPFKLEWLSTNRLPFYRTRGLRNPWNSNREVKIARDGTELESSVGRRLIGLFNRIHSPVPTVGGMRAMMGAMPGHAGPRPYGPG